MFIAFSKLAIYEAVEKELLTIAIRNYIYDKISASKLIVLKDASLSVEEKVLRNNFEKRIAKHSMYDPYYDNCDDR